MYIFQVLTRHRRNVNGEEQFQGLIDSTRCQTIIHKAPLKDFQQLTLRDLHSMDPCSRLFIDKSYARLRFFGVQALWKRMVGPLEG